ncbi:MAG TPA: amidohydrolase family protein [Pseudonocardiaceae bacterium]|nr:amidohydrolase family protein [Pseudonocardiaceae bacterium]
MTAAPQPYEGPIVDAHVHFWAPELHHHPWLEPGAAIPFRYGDYSAIKRRYLPPDYRHDCAGHDIRKTVYIETEWDPRDPLGEVDYVTGLAAEFGWPNAMVAHAVLDSPDVEDLLAAFGSAPLVRGIRHKPGGAATVEQRRAGQRTLLTDPRWQSGFALLAKHDLAFELQTHWCNLTDARQLAEDHPAVPIIVDHAGLPADRGPDGLRAWRDALVQVAEPANVAIKISGIGDPGHPWTAEHNAWIVRAVIDVFGVDRVMFASNYPVDRLCADFDTIYRGFKGLTAELSAADQSKLFHDNAIRYYGLDQHHRAT